MYCEANSPGPAPTTIRKYKPECGQDIRPGRPARELGKDEDRGRAKWKDEDKGLYYKWTTTGPGKAYYKAPNPNNSLSLYKNHEGCTRYTTKKKYCDPLHPKNEPNRVIDKIDRNEIDRNDYRALARLMKDYENCINSIDDMGGCVQRGVDPEGDFRHDEEKRFRAEDLAKITRLYNAALARRDLGGAEDREADQGAWLVEQAKQKADDLAKEAEDKAATSEETKQKHEETQRLQKKEAKAAEEEESAKVDNEARAEERVETIVQDKTESGYDSQVEKLNTAYENAMTSASGVTRSQRSNAVNEFCTAWNELRLYPTSRYHTLHTKKKTLLNNMQTNIQVLGDDVIKKLLKRGKCKINDVNWAQNQLDPDWETVGFRNAEGGQRKKTKKAKMKRKHKKTKNKKGKTKKKMGRKTLKNTKKNKQKH
ncbi:hypothetical protein N9O88_00420 [bacterium]|nr:hypothetical protein [bacterium]